MNTNYYSAIFQITASKRFCFFSRTQFSEWKGQWQQPTVHDWWMWFGIGGEVAERNTWLWSVPLWCLWSLVHHKNYDCALLVHDKVEVYFIVFLLTHFCNTIKCHRPIVLYCIMINKVTISNKLINLLFFN